MRRMFRRRTTHLLAAILVSLCAFVLADLISIPEPVPASDRPAHRLLRAAQRHGLEEHVAVLSPGQTIGW